MYIATKHKELILLPYDEYLRCLDRIALVWYQAQQYSYMIEMAPTIEPELNAARTLAVNSR